MSSNNTGTIFLSAQSNDCSVDTVTIYKDRAEVVRKIRFPKPQANGTNLFHFLYSLIFYCIIAFLI